MEKSVLGNNIYRINFVKTCNNPDIKEAIDHLLNSSRSIVHLDFYYTTYTVGIVSTLPFHLEISYIQT